MDQNILEDLNNWIIWHSTKKNIPDNPNKLENLANLRRTQAIIVNV